MISQMDRTLIFGINYAKPHFPGISRQAQADRMKEAHCTSTQDGIDLANIWTGPGQYNWAVTNPDNCGLTYDQVVDISVEHGIEVFGRIGTTPWWAMPGDGTTSNLTQDANAGQNYVKVASTAGFEVGKHVRLQDNSAPANVEAQEIQSIPDLQTLVFTQNLARSYTVAANGRCTQVRQPLHQWPPDEQYAQAFIDACQEVASHFLGCIRYFTFWNEPNYPGGWHDADVVDYTKWLFRCHQGVKAGNPNALLAIGGLLPAGDTGFVDQIRANGGQNSYEAIALHPYPTAPPDTGPIDGVHAMWANMQVNGDGAKSIWCNEYGWQITAVDEATQALRIEDALTKLRFGDHYYITMASLHLIADTNGAKYGICDGNLNPRQTFYRFQAMAPHLQSRAPFVVPV